MKFVKPEMEIKMFAVEDVMTTSSAAPSTSSSWKNPLVPAQTDTIDEGNCVGTKADNWLEDCL